MHRRLTPRARHVQIIAIGFTISDRLQFFQAFIKHWFQVLRTTHRPPRQTTCDDIFKHNSHTNSSKAYSTFAFFLLFFDRSYMDKIFANYTGPTENSDSLPLQNIGNYECHCNMLWNSTPSVYHCTSLWTQGDGEADTFLQSKFAIQYKTCMNKCTPRHWLSSLRASTVNHEALRLLFSWYHGCLYRKSNRWRYCQWATQKRLQWRKLE